MLEQIKKLGEDEKSEEEKLKKIQYDNKLLENKIEQILKEASRPSIKKQTIKTPYWHPNYKNHFDQRQGQNEHKQRSCDFRKETTQSTNQAENKKLYTTKRSTNSSNEERSRMDHITLDAAFFLGNS